MSFPHTHSVAPITSPPEKQVVAAVIEREDRVLICLRPLGKQHGGMWEFPGGKIHPDESTHEAVIRELTEELAVTTAWVGKVLFSTVDQKSGFEILFIPATIEGEPQALEHSALAWCERAELLSYPLAPSDRAFASYLLGRP